MQAYNYWKISFFEPGNSRTMKLLLRRTLLHNNFIQL